MNYTVESSQLFCTNVMLGKYFEKTHLSNEDLFTLLKKNQLFELTPDQSNDEGKNVFIY